MRLLQPAVRYGYVPAMLLGVNGLALGLISAGHSYVWTAAAMLFAAVGASFVAERILPYEDVWNDPRGDTGKDLAHAAVYEFQNVAATLLLPIIALLWPWDGIWPQSWPLVFQLLLAVVVTDVGLTLMHYVSHKWPPLWRLHAIHHGVHRVYGFNGFIRHPLHQAIDLVVTSLPLVLLGMPVDVAVLLGIAVSVQLLVQHANVDYDLGPLQPWLAVGPVHRLHHVNWAGEGDVNFGLFVTIWDRMLGTLRLPAEAPRPMDGDIGVTGEPAFPQTYVEQLMLPFRAAAPPADVVETPVTAETPDPRRHRRKGPTMFAHGGAPHAELGE